MTWSEIDWSILDRLREGFISGAAANGPYWQSSADLAHYDFTYAERIGWKWDAVLDELAARAWSPAPGLIVDWGCGSGIASRRVLARWPALVTTSQLRLADHSTAAVDFATDRARRTFPGLEVAPFNAAAAEPVATLVVSHVLNELNPTQSAELFALMARAQTVIWVEPGTSDVAARLIRAREELRHTFRVILPCPHQGPCGLLDPANERDWCHHYAKAPKGIYADADWVRFGQRAGVDLRSLPYACLVLENQAHDRRHAEMPEGAARILARPQFFKPYARLLSCEAPGVSFETIPKRKAAPLLKALEKTRGPLLYQWTRDGGVIVAGHALVPDDSLVP